MANGFLDYSKIHRCPICGGPDYCTFRPQPNGSVMYICMRHHGYRKGDVFVSNIDQQEYECKGENESGNLYFYLKADADAWREAHGYKKGKGKRTQTRKAAPVQKQYVEEPKIKPLSNEKLHYIYYTMLSLLKLEDADRKYLHGEGFTDEMIDKYMIRSLPKPDNYRFRNRDSYHSINPSRRDIAQAVAKIFGGDLTGAPGFYQFIYQIIEENGNLRRWDISGPGGILFPLFDPYGNMYRLRVRVQEEDLKGGKYGKYRNFSSYRDELVGGVLKNKYLNGCAANNNCGFYSNEGDDFRVVFITEGEKKSIIANEYFKKPFISLPGVNSHSKLLDVVNADENTQGMRFIDFLKEKGTKLVIVAFDADKTVNDSVLRQEEQTFRRLKAEGFTIGCAEWDMAYGKGIDDLLKNGHEPVYRFVEV